MPMHEHPLRKGGRVATDIGGTFTDLFHVQDGQVSSVKCPSTPERLEQGIANAIDTALRNMLLLPGRRAAAESGEAVEA